MLNCVLGAQNVSFLALRARQVARSAPASIHIVKDLDAMFVQQLAMITSNDVLSSHARILVRTIDSSDLYVRTLLMVA